LSNVTRVKMTNCLSPAAICVWGSAGGQEPRPSGTRAVSAPGPYGVQYDPKALKELTKLDKPAARRILEAIDALSGGPRPSGARPLLGYPDLARIRVGDHQVAYTA
jgi:mRNA interferase RelE/StbE